MKKELWVRLWCGNVIVADLMMDQNGFGTWTSRPEMPNNAVNEPDVQVDLWAGYVKYGKADVQILSVNPAPEVTKQ